MGERPRNNSAAKETTETLFPQIPNSARTEERKKAQRPTKAFFAFSLEEKEKKQNNTWAGSFTLRYKIKEKA